jgi:hypothetical protein
LLLDAGYVITQSPSEADLNIIVTCTNHL